MVVFVFGAYGSIYKFGPVNVSNNMVLVDFTGHRPNDINSELINLQKPSNKYLTNVPCSFSTSQDIGTTLLLTWTAFPDANVFAIQYRVPGGNWIGAPAYTNQAKMINLTPNTYYECQVVIYKNSLMWGISQLGGFTTGSESYSKSLDMGTTAQITYNSFAPWASSYTLQYRVIGTTTWLGASSTTNQAKVVNMIPNSNYECRLNVYIGGVLWGICQLGTFHTESLTFTKSQDMGTTLLMSWTNLPWATNYTLQVRKLGTTTWIGAPSLTNQIKVPNLLPNTDYECRLNVFISSGFWGYSALDTIHTDLVVFNIISDNVTSMQLGWNSFAPWATSYTLQYRLPLSSSWASSANTTNTNIQISPVINGQDYFIRLKIFIGTTLWGISQEEKIGRTIPAKESMTGKEGENAYDKINVFPNPFTENIKVEISQKDITPFSWTLYDLIGNQLKSGNSCILPENKVFDIPTSDLSKGVYIFSVISNENRQSFRIVKQ